AGGRAHLGAADLLQRPDLRGGEEDHLDGRRRGAVPHPALQPVSAARRVAATLTPITPRRAGLVAAAAAVVYLGALWNGFALDDLTIIVANPLVHGFSGVWRAFGASYFPPNIDVSAYRPLAVATYALDWTMRSTAWFHAVNLTWHVAASVLGAALAGRWAGDTAGLVAGIVFAVHPVHVEAVAYVVGRNELMAAVFPLLAVYAALEPGS